MKLRISAHTAAQLKAEVQRHDQRQVAGRPRKQVRPEAVHQRRHRVVVQQHKRQVQVVTIGIAYLRM
jgi:hypothetical protein